jgi:hypothetical protein
MFLSCPLLLSAEGLAAAAPALADMPWLRVTLATYSLGDILFYIWFRRTLRTAQKPTSPPVVRLDVHQRVWRAILHSALDGESPFHFLTTWFPVPLHRVGREDVRNCLAVGFFGSPLLKLRPGCQEVTEVDRMLGAVERHLHPFPPGE